jgi:succinoglycan biosynthesis protein ExoM
LRSSKTHCMKVSICIATYKRSARLAVLLEDLAKQERRADQVVIIDNDATGSAREVVEEFRAAAPPFAIDYDIQPVRNIALTRNRSVELAGGEWLAFIDDDERAPPAWLRQLFEAVEHYQADGVLAPVIPIVPDDAPDWIRRGRFYDFARQPTGVPVPLNCMRFGNVMLRGDQVRALRPPFNPVFALGSGEDSDLLVRLCRRGAKIVWCDEAIVTEPIEPKKLSLRWLMLRSESGGQDFGQKTVAGEYGPIGRTGRMLFFARVFAQMCAAAAMAGLLVPIGRHRAAQWLIVASANFGKLSVLWGRRSSAWA